MYELIKIEKENLLGGFKLKYISEKLGLSEAHFNRLVNNKQTFKRITALALISLCEDISINDDIIEDKIKQYFKEV